MQLFYREKGNRTLPSLIILHGLWGASENWLPVANGLAEHYHVLLPDLPNHGASPHIPRHDYNTLADCIYEWIMQLDLPAPPYLAGHSMGGKTLMTLLLKHPEITSKAIIIDIAPKDYARTPETRQHENLCCYLQSTLPGKFQERNAILTDIKTYFPENDTFQLLAKNIRKNKETGSFEWKINIPVVCREIIRLQDWETPSPCRPYTGKLLFIKGENSNYIDLKEDLPAIRHLFPQATFSIIPATAHAIHAEQPALLAGCILKFLQE